MNYIILALLLVQSLQDDDIDISVSGFKAAIEALVNGDNNTFAALSTAHQDTLLCIVGVEVVKPDDDYCDSLYENVRNQSVCNSYEFTDGVHKCCFVHVELDNYKNNFCKKIADNKHALQDVKNSFKHSKKIRIECFGFNIKIGFILLIFLLLL